jgi:predicted outer membrane repeat protein
MQFRLAAIAAALLCSSASATNYVVRPDGSGDFLTIAAALAVAAPNDTVTVGPGVYAEHGLVMRSGVRLISEFDDPKLTTIDAEGLGRCLDVVLASPTIQSLVRGLTFQNGSADDGGAIRAVDRTSVRNCVFVENNATGRGGAVFLAGGVCRSGILSACVFRSNHAAQGGAADVGCINVLSCSFIGNTADESGGAVFMTGYWDDESNYFASCLFARNRAGTRGGAALAYAIYVDFYSCTFVANEAPTESALRLDLGINWLHECIVAFNVGNGCAVSVAKGTICSNFFGNSGGDDPCSAIQWEDISAYPFFCDPPNDDFHLGANSPCLPEHNSCEARMGAFGQGCGTVDVERASWGRIKAAYRE